MYYMREYGGQMAKYLACRCHLESAVKISDHRQIILNRNTAEYHGILSSSSVLGGLLKAIADCKQKLAIKNHQR